MEFFSEQYFLEQKQTISINEQRMFSARVQNTSSETWFDIFLSYNISNLDVVKAIYYVLTKQELKVYLDCIVDPYMQRNNCGEATAQKIHNRLMHSRALLYAQSPNAGQSNWMPWELGIVDGHTHKCFVMPVTANATQVTPKREYLSLYPYIKPDTNNVMKIISEGTQPGLFVTDFVKYIKGIR